MKFIYVFGKDKERMLEHGFELVSSDPKNGVYVFLNQDRQDFSELDIPCVFSNVLTF